jgi:hypothetical protein
VLRAAEAGLLPEEIAEETGSGADAVERCVRRGGRVG